MINMDDLYRTKLYCGNRNCLHLECVRHDRYVPFDVLIIRENYKLDKGNNCNHILLDWEEEHE
jgi:hypothetical protein